MERQEHNQDQSRKETQTKQNTASSSEAQASTDRTQKPNEAPSKMYVGEKERQRDDRANQGNRESGETKAMDQEVDARSESVKSDKNRQY